MRVSTLIHMLCSHLIKVTYDGTQDLTQVGVKPISIHVEDFDSNGNVKSAIPVEERD